MQNYSVPDFMSYYGGSFLLHPVTNEVVKIVGEDHEREGHVRLSDKSTVHLKELDWKHVQTPQLGYRSLESGRLLYYVSRRAQRIREKGVTPVAIMIEVPNIVSALAQQLGYSDDVQRLGVLNDKLAKSLFYPEYIGMKEAVEQLSDKPHAVAFALSSDWAVSIGLHKDKPYLLHYKNSRVAFSGDGKTWTFNDPDARYIFDRSKVNG